MLHAAHCTFLSLEMPKHEWPLQTHPQDWHSLSLDRQDPQTLYFHFIHHHNHITLGAR